MKLETGHGVIKNYTSKWWLEVNKINSWMKMNAGK